MFNCIINVILEGILRKKLPSQLKYHYTSLGVFSREPENKGMNNPMTDPNQGLLPQTVQLHLPEPTFSPTFLSAGGQERKARAGVGKVGLLQM